MKTPIAEMFLENFSDDFLERYFSGLIDVHSLARAEAQVYDTPEATNHEPALRRVKAQTLAADVASQMPGVTAIASQGEVVKSSWFHRRVQCGRAILTISAASYPDELIQLSDFRLQYAQQTERQRTLFDDEDSHDTVATDAWTVYGVLLHGRGLEPRGRLGFAVIRFLLPDATGYYASRVDLFKMFPQIVAEKLPLVDYQADVDDDLDIDFHDGENIG